MALQVSVAVRNAMLDAMEVAIGASPVLRVRTGSPPVNCAAADTGSVLAELTLPPDWMLPASGGVKAKTGTWQDASADASGAIGHFRLYDATGTVCHSQGSAGLLGDLITDTDTVTAGQSFTVNTYSLAAGNS